MDDQDWAEFDEMLATLDDMAADNDAHVFATLARDGILTGTSC